VLIYDEERPYRPALLAAHVEFKEMYEQEARAREDAEKAKLAEAASANPANA
jgi:hypothetical protein